MPDNPYQSPTDSPNEEHVPTQMSRLEVRRYGILAVIAGFFMIHGGGTVCALRVSRW